MGVKLLCRMVSGPILGALCDSHGRASCRFRWVSVGLAVVVGPPALDLPFLLPFLFWLGGLPYQLPCRVTSLLQSHVILQTRFVSSALLPFLFWGEGSPTKMEYRKRVPLF